MTTTDIAREAQSRELIPRSSGTLPAVSSGSLSAYLDTVQRIPVLTREEEVMLFSEFGCEIGRAHV